MFGVLEGCEWKQNPDLMNEIILAYIGDCVYELYVRNFSIGTGKAKTRDLSRISAGFSKAASQANVLRRLEASLSEEERKIVKRARNKKITSKPKNADPMDYKLATAFEALVGYLYLKGESERLEAVIAAAILGKELEETSKKSAETVDEETGEKAEREEKNEQSGRFI